MKVQKHQTSPKNDTEGTKTAGKSKLGHIATDSFSKSKAADTAPGTSKVTEHPRSVLHISSARAPGNELPSADLKSFAVSANVAPVDPAQKLAALSVPSVDPAPVEGSSWQKGGDLQLYPNGLPSASDIQQHGFGDCYCITTLSSLASSHPEFIRQSITKNTQEPSSYDVKMFDPSGASIVVSVNDSIAVNANGQTVSATGGDGQPNWASIAEKAYAKYTEAYPREGAKEGYNALEDGGRPADAMKAFTGQDAARLPTTSVGGTMDDAALAEKMRASIASGVPLVADTAYEDTNSMVLSSGERIVGSHAYTVSQAYQDSAGNYRVQVRNPWGSTPQVIEGKKYSVVARDGVIDMSMKEYQAVFNGTTIGGGNAAATGVNMNTRTNAWGAQQVAKHKDPENTAVYNDVSGEYSVIAGQDVSGNPQVQVFDGKGDRDEEFNFKGGTTMEANTSYLVADRYVNVDANGKPSIATSATNQRLQAWDMASNAFRETTRNPLQELNGGLGPH